MATLDELKVGQRGRVLNVDCDDEAGLRMLEMGLTPGVEVRVLGTAPLGDPLELELRGFRLSVRKSEAKRVAVQPS